MMKYEQVKVRCSYCGKEIVIKGAQLKYNKHFCDTKCHHLFISQEAKKKLVKGRCLYCGKEIERSDLEIRGKNCYCSIECHNAHQREQSKKSFTILKCTNCGKIFKKRKSMIADGQKLFFCSRKCNFEYKRIINEYILSKDFAKIVIPSRNGNIKEVLIDLEDVEKCKRYLWIVTKTNYVRNKEVGFLHRYVTECPSDKVIDHINHNTLDNRKDNLRISTVLQNNHNKLTSTEESGIYRMKNGKYIVRLFYKGDIINLGTYSDKETAIKVRKEYKENLHIYG